MHCQYTYFPWMRPDNLNSFAPWYSSVPNRCLRCCFVFLSFFLSVNLSRWVRTPITFGNPWFCIKLRNSKVSCKKQHPVAKTENCINYIIKKIYMLSSLTTWNWQHKTMLWKSKSWRKKKREKKLQLHQHKYSVKSVPNRNNPKWHLTISKPWLASMRSSARSANFAQSIMPLISFGHSTNCRRLFLPNKFCHILLNKLHYVLNLTKKLRKHLTWYNSNWSPNLRYFKLSIMLYKTLY